CGFGVPPLQGVDDPAVRFDSVLAYAGNSYGTAAAGDGKLAEAHHEPGQEGVAGRPRDALVQVKVGLQELLGVVDARLRLSDTGFQRGDLLVCNALCSQRHDADFDNLAGFKKLEEGRVVDGEDKPEVFDEQIGFRSEEHTSELQSRE